MFGLFGELVPKTVKNFASLCTSKMGLTKNGKPKTYKGSEFHRIIPGFFAQGGDITHDPNMPELKTVDDFVLKNHKGRTKIPSYPVYDT